MQDYNHSVTKSLIYMHSMQTFLFSELKRASFEKDESRIPSLGPYAAALSFIICNAHKSRLNASKENRKKYSNLTVYRGICMSHE